MRRLATVSLAALLLGTVGLASSGPLPVSTARHCR